MPSHSQTPHSQYHQERTPPKKQKAPERSQLHPSAFKPSSFQAFHRRLVVDPRSPIPHRFTIRRRLYLCLFFSGFLRILRLPAGDATFHTLVSDDLRIKTGLTEDCSRRSTFGIPAHAIIPEFLGIADSILGNRFNGLQRPEIFSGFSSERNSWHCTLLTFLFPPHGHPPPIVVKGQAISRPIIERIRRKTARTRIFDIISYN